MQSINTADFPIATDQAHTNSNATNEVRNIKIF